MLPTGELLVFSVTSSDAQSSYRCRTVHRVTGDTVESSSYARLVVTGKFSRDSARVSFNHRRSNFCPAQYLMAASARSNFVDHRYVSRAPDGDGLNAPITALFLSLSLVVYFLHNLSRAVCGCLCKLNRDQRERERGLRRLGETLIRWSNNSLLWIMKPFKFERPLKC